MTVESFADDDSRATPMQSRKSRDFRAQASRLECCRYVIICTGLAVILAVAILIIFMRSDSVAESVQDFFT